MPKPKPKSKVGPTKVIQRKRSTQSEHLQSNDKIFGSPTSSSSSHNNNSNGNCSYNDLFYFSLGGKGGKGRMSNLKHVTDDEEFRGQIKFAGDDLIVVDFYTTWCGPCRQMESVVQSLAMKYPNVLFLKVDADQCFETAMQHDVKGVPLFVLYRSAHILDRVQVCI